MPRHGWAWLFLLMCPTLVPAQQSLPDSLQEHPIVLKNGKLLTVSHGTINPGILIISDGKIAALGKVGDVAIPANSKVIDVSGMTVYPGLIDSETNLGLTEVSLNPATNDLVELSDETLPQLHVSDAFHAESELIPVDRMNGVTNAIVAPTSESTLPGQDAFIQLAGGSRSEMLLKKDLALPFNFTGEQRRSSSGKAPLQFPVTRMGMAAQTRQLLIQAQEYAQSLKSKKGKAESEGSPKRDLKLEALLPYLSGEKPVVAAASEPNDISTVLGLAAEFHLRIILNHATHCESVIDRIASAKVPVVFGPVYESPKDSERYDAVYRLPGELYARGVKVAFASYASHYARDLPYEAGMAVEFGLPHDEALRALTLTPAEIWGVADSLGSLDAGKTANVVVANGDPLDVSTDVLHVFIDGKEIPMRSRQTELRDQYSQH